VRDFLFGQIDGTHYAKLFTIYNQALSQVWVCFPESGSAVCTRALIWDVLKNIWGTRALANVRHGATGYVNDAGSSLLWDAITETWDQLNILWNAENFSSATRSMILADGNILELVGRAGTFSEGYLERLSLSFGEAERFKFVKRIHVRGTGGTIYVRVGSQAVAGAAVAWSAEMPLILGTDAFVNCAAQGRYISVSIRVPEDSLITAVNIEAELRGYT
jgi:hypothetical protein